MILKATSSTGKLQPSLGPFSRNHKACIVHQCIEIDRAVNLTEVSQHTWAMLGLEPRADDSKVLVFPHWLLPIKNVHLVQNNGKAVMMLKCGGRNPVFHCFNKNQGSEMAQRCIYTQRCLTTWVQSAEPTQEWWKAISNTIDRILWLLCTRHALSQNNIVVFKIWNFSNSKSLLVKKEKYKMLYSNVFCLLQNL